MFLLLYMHPRNHGFVANELMEYWILLGLLGEVERIDKKLAAAEKILEELNDGFLKLLKCIVSSGIWLFTSTKNVPNSSLRLGMGLENLCTKIGVSSRLP